MSAPRQVPFFGLLCCVQPAAGGLEEKQELIGLELFVAFMHRKTAYYPERPPCPFITRRINFEVQQLSAVALQN